MRMVTVYSAADSIKISIIDLYGVLALSLIFDTSIIRSTIMAVKVVVTTSETNPVKIIVIQIWSPMGVCCEKYGKEN